MVVWHTGGDERRRLKVWLKEAAKDSLESEGSEGCLMDCVRQIQYQARRPRVTVRVIDMFLLPCDEDDPS